jgi:diamine N-acetyltransferase
MTVIVQIADTGAAEIVAMLGCLTFRETFEHLFRRKEDELSAYLDYTFSVSKIRSSIAKPENHYWLALLDGLPIGYAKLKHPSLNTLVADGSAAQLQKIYVLSEFLSHRAGYALLRAVTAKAKEAGVEAMWLTVLDSNQRAIGFYERNHWSDVGGATFSIGSQEFSFRVLKTSLGGDSAAS